MADLVHFFFHSIGVILSSKKETIVPGRWINEYFSQEEVQCLDPSTPSEINAYSLIWYKISLFWDTLTLTALHI